MDPQVKENKPGKCPICKMELTAGRKTNQQHTDEIELSAQQVQLGNIHVDTIGKSSITGQMLLNAELNFDPLKSIAVSTKAKGRIDKLYFKVIGDYVPKGAKLFDLYSEELNSAKQEYLLVLEKQKALDNSVIDFAQLLLGAKNKLFLWGLSEAQIEELARNKKPSTITTFYSSTGGFLTTLDIKEGDYILEGGTVVILTDLSTLWAEAQVYSSQLFAINIHDNVLVRFPDLPSKQVTGKIEFMNPENNPDTRINLIRMSISNADGQLKPGMKAYFTVQNMHANVFSLPTDAVIRASHGAAVWVQTGHNQFKHKIVELGLENSDRVEISPGFKKGK